MAKISVLPFPCANSCVSWVLGKALEKDISNRPFKKAILLFRFDVKIIALVNIFIYFKQNVIICLDVHLPAAPVACEWVTDVACVCHLADELWHWAVDLHCLAKNSLCSECLVCCHYKKGDQNRRR